MKHLALNATGSLLLPGKPACWAAPILGETRRSPGAALWGDHCGDTGADPLSHFNRPH